jgi:hypothetical protein
VHVQHLAGQHFTPVIHHAPVLQVVVAEFKLLVSEGLAFEEQLLVTPQTTVQWMPARVDHPGIG